MSFSQVVSLISCDKLRQDSQLQRIGRLCAVVTAKAMCLPSDETVSLVLWWQQATHVARIHDLGGPRERWWGCRLKKTALFPRVFVCKFVTTKRYRRMHVPARNHGPFHLRGFSSFHSSSCSFLLKREQLGALNWYESNGAGMVLCD